MHHRPGHGRPRIRARRWAACGAALASTAAALALTMSGAHAETRSASAYLTLTGLVDTSCPVAAGGTTAYVAPGGTVTLHASLVGASLRLPLLGSVQLDSSHVASFADTVTVDGVTSTLRAGGTLVLHDVTDTTAVQWRATAVTLLPAIAGGITVPLDANNVELPAGAELDWTGQIVPSANTRCGVALALPTIKASVGTHTVTVPGIGVTVSLPGRPTTTTAAPSTPPESTTPSSSAPPASSSPADAPGTEDPSSRSGAGTAQPSRGPVDEPSQSSQSSHRHRMPAAVRHATTRVAPPADAASATGRVAAPQSGKAAVPVGDVRQAADNRAGRDIAAPGTERLSGGTMPALLAIAAVLALSFVTALYVRRYLAGEQRR